MRTEGNLALAPEKGLRAKVERVLQEFGHEPGQLLAILKTVQKELGHLSREALRFVARGLNLPPSQVSGVATFYSLFNLEPQGAYHIRVCESAPCHVQGAEAVMAALEEELGIGFGEMTPDGRFSLEKVSCLGICGVAPAIMVNETVYGNLTSAKVKEVIERYRRLPVGEEV